MTDDRLRSAYRDALARRADTHPEEVSVEALVDVVERRGPEEARLATLDRVARSPELLAELEFLRAAAAGADPTDAPEGRPRRVLRHARAAAAVVAAGLGSLWARAGPMQAPAFRDAGEAVRLLAPGPRSDDVAPTFVWGAVGSAVRYRLEVLSAAGAPAFLVTTVDTTASPPPGVALERGSEYRWWVVAVRRDGVEVRAPPRPLEISR